MIAARIASTADDAGFCFTSQPYETAKSSEKSAEWEGLAPHLGSPVSSIRPESAGPKVNPQPSLGTNTRSSEQRYQHTNNTDYRYRPVLLAILNVDPWSRRGSRVSSLTQTVVSQPK